MGHQLACELPLLGSTSPFIAELIFRPQPLKPTASILSPDASAQVDL